MLAVVVASASLISVVLTTFVRAAGSTTEVDAPLTRHRRLLYLPSMTVALTLGSSFTRLPPARCAFTLWRQGATTLGFADRPHRRRRRHRRLPSRQPRHRHRVQVRACPLFVVSCVPSRDAKTSSRLGILGTTDFFQK